MTVPSSKTRYAPRHIPGNELFSLKKENRPLSLYPTMLYDACFSSDCQVRASAEWKSSHKRNVVKQDKEGEIKKKRGQQDKIKILKKKKRYFVTWRRLLKHLPPLLFKRIATRWSDHHNGQTKKMNLSFLNKNGKVDHALSIPNLGLEYSWLPKDKKINNSLCLVSRQNWLLPKPIRARFHACLLKFLFCSPSAIWILSRSLSCLVVFIGLFCVYFWMNINRFWTLNDL